MKTKVILLTLALIGPLAIVANAQNRKGKIKEEKMLFINDYCKFTENEANTFWPLHDEMEKKMKRVKKTMRREMEDIRDEGLETMSDSDIKTAMSNRKNYEQQLLDIKWEYNDKFVDAVGYMKTAKFYEGEAIFRKKLLKRLKQLKMDGDPLDE